MKLLNYVIQYQYDIVQFPIVDEIFIQKPTEKITQDTVKVVDKKYKTQYEHNVQTLYNKTNKEKK